MKLFSLLCSIAIAMATASSNLRVAFKKGDAVLGGRKKNCPEDAFGGTLHKFADKPEMLKGTTGSGSAEELAALGCKKDVAAMASFKLDAAMPTQYFYCKYFKKEDEYYYKSCKLSADVRAKMEE